jgi:hypothetical protein
VPGEGRVRCEEAILQGKSGKARDLDGRPAAGRAGYLRQILS